MNIFFTGGNSFIGGYIIPKLVADGHKVYVNMRRADGLKNIQNDVVPILGNLMEISKIEFPQANNIDCVIHFASSSPRDNVGHEKLYCDNILATHELVNWALKHRVDKFIFASTISVYGNITDKNLNEESNIVNPSFYGITKLVGEHALKSNQNEISTMALRLPGVVGKRSDERIWLHRISDKMMKNQKIIINNPYNIFSSIIHAESIAEFISGLCQTSFSGFNYFPLGADEYIYNIDLLTKMKNLLDSRAKISIVGDERGGYVIDNMLAKSFGYTPWKIDKTLRFYANDIKSAYKANQ